MCSVLCSGLCVCISTKTLGIGECERRGVVCMVVVVMAVSRKKKGDAECPVEGERWGVREGRREGRG